MSNEVTYLIPGNCHACEPMGVGWLEGNGFLAFRVQNGPRKGQNGWIGAGHANFGRFFDNFFLSFDFWAPSSSGGISQQPFSGNKHSDQIIFFIFYPHFFGFHGFHKIQPSTSPLMQCVFILGYKLKVLNFLLLAPVLFDCTSALPCLRLCN